MHDSNRKFVIFDLDGTLIDSFECVLRCVNRTLKLFELQPVVIPDSNNSKDIEYIFCRAKEISNNVVQYSEFKRQFDLFHLEDCLNDVRTNPIGENLMRQYFNDGYSILILTNKKKCIADKICNHLFTDINYTIIGREDINHIKSNWHVVVEKLSEIDVCPGECYLYVGDSEIDEQLAKSLSIKYLDILSFKPKELKAKSFFRNITFFLTSNSKIFGIIGKFTLIVGVIFSLYSCYSLYKCWNIIPSHTFEADLSCEGYSSKNSYSNLRLQIDAGSTTEESKYNTNVIQIYNSDEYDENISLNQFLYGKCNYLFTTYPKRFFNKISYYFLNYKVSSNISSTIHNKDYVGIVDGNDCTLSYIENPQLFTDSIGTYAIGSGVLGFCKSKGAGSLNLSVSLLNNKPTLKSPWAIDQANYTIWFKTEHIKCDTISVEFMGATIFSNMYPQPDKITVSGIEFYTPDKIGEIAKNGVRFHTDFIELKEIGARRTFLLSGFVSLIISLMASIILKWIYK